MKKEFTVTMGILVSACFAVIGCIAYALVIAP